MFTTELNGVCKKCVPEALDFNKTDAERQFHVFLRLIILARHVSISEFFFSAVQVCSLPGTTTSVTGGALTERSY